MKINPGLLNGSFRNASFGEGKIFKPLREQLYLNSSKIAGQKKMKNINYLNFLWNKLLFKPENFSPKPQTPIYDIFLEETEISSIEIISSVLAEKLGLPKKALKISRALEESNQIYHEDYPGDFVLEYQSERLGMAILDICYNTNQEETPVYRFNPNIKSFNGLF